MAGSNPPPGASWPGARLLIGHDGGVRCGARSGKYSPLRLNRLRKQQLSAQLPSLYTQASSSGAGMH